MYICPFKSHILINNILLMITDFKYYPIRYVDANINNSKYDCNKCA